MAPVFCFLKNLFILRVGPTNLGNGNFSMLHNVIFIGSNLSICIVYFTIPFLLVKLAHKRPDIPFPKVFYLFITFVFLFAFKHLLDALMMWWPAYKLNTLLSLITAGVSVASLLSFLKIFPQLLAFKTSTQFEVEINERKKTEVLLDLDKNRALEQLNARNLLIAELTHSKKEMEQFAYIASHDLQEPLRNVTNYVGLFQKKYADKLDKNSEAYLVYIKEATARMQALINDLLEYSRIGRHDENMSKIDCDKLLQITIKDLSVAIKKNKAKIKTGKLPVIDGYPTEIKSLFQNLVANAIKFRKPEEPLVVHVSAEEKEQEWIFAIADNGIGIDKTHFERIFTIFQRLHTRTEYEGTGIGLAHCKKIIDLHHGRIWLASEPGKGSTFYFSLPKHNLK